MNASGSRRSAPCRSSSGSPRPDTGRHARPNRCLKSCARGAAVLRMADDKAGKKVTELPDSAPDATALTMRQQKVLVTIKDAIEKRGYPPSMREIGEAVG